MSTQPTQQEIEEMRLQAQKDCKQAIDDLKRDAPSIAEGLGAALGSALGAGGSLAALTFLGVTGLSAAGITSGLATAGAIIGGGMAAGIGVLAAPVAVLGIAGFALAKKRKQAIVTAALHTAIKKLYTVQERLLKNAEYFQEELATIKASLEYLESKDK